MRKIPTLIPAILLLTAVAIYQETTTIDIRKKLWVASSDFLLGKLKAIRWNYDVLIDRSYESSYTLEEELYAGNAHPWGMGLAYHRYIWKGLYSAAHALPLLQKYMNEDKTKIQNDLQLSPTLRVGYYIRLFHNRKFIEPSITITHQPINTNLPESFKKKEH